MARKFYPGLTKTENARTAKYAYRLAGDADERVCIVISDHWFPTRWENDDRSQRVLEDYSVYHIKDAETGELLSVDTRKGGYVRRKTHIQPSWIH